MCDVCSSNILDGNWLMLLWTHQCSTALKKWYVRHYMFDTILKAHFEVLLGIAMIAIICLFLWCEHYCVRDFHYPESDDWQAKVASWCWLQPICAVRTVWWARQTQSCVSTSASHSESQPFPVNKLWHLHIPLEDLNMPDRCDSDRCVYTMCHFDSQHAITSMFDNSVVYTCAHQGIF